MPRRLRLVSSTRGGICLLLLNLKSLLVVVIVAVRVVFSGFSAVVSVVTGNASRCIDDSEVHVQGLELSLSRRVVLIIGLGSVCSSRLGLCCVAMEALERGLGLVGRSAFTPGFSVEDSSRVRVTLRKGLVKVVSAARPLRSMEGVEFVGRRRIAESERVQERVDARSVTAHAAMMGGLGDSLKSGYVLKYLVVVDEHTEVDSTGDVIEKLKNGFRNFKVTQYNQKPDLYARLAEGQQPKVMMITCADSRVCPTMLHGLEAGEAFIVRNVANLVPPCEESGEHHGTSAAIEFAVTVLGVERIVVMGHSNCGGIRALMTRDAFSGDFVGSWIRIGLPAKKKALSVMKGKPLQEQCRFCEQEAVNVSLANLLTFPFIEERVKSGKLRIHGMHYNFIDGQLTSWEIEPEEAPVYS